MRALVRGASAAPSPNSRQRAGLARMETYSAISRILMHADAWISSAPSPGHIYVPWALGRSAGTVAWAQVGAAGHGLGVLDAIANTRPGRSLGAPSPCPGLAK